jgi:DNA-binding LacI/PurR family transcriptional regulator
MLVLIHNIIRQKNSFVPLLWYNIYKAFLKKFIRLIGVDIMVTRKDVARFAGVSNTTVSRVLNNNGYVSPESRERVEAAIKELGYTPNLIARGLKTKKSGQLLFCASEFSNPFYMEVYEGMEQYAKQFGYTIVVASYFDQAIISQRQFDGVILSNVDMEKEQEFLSLDTPLIINNYTPNSYRLTSIKINIEQGAYKAMNHLYSMGHREIAFITNIASDDEQRLRGYKNFLEDNGIPVNPDYIFVNTDPSSPYEQGFNAATQLIKSLKSVTAVFAFNDAMAIGAISAFGQNNISVPRDISVIGFDDILQARFSTPALTTMKIPKYELGVESIKMLIRKIEGEPVHSFTLDSELIMRDSIRSL